MFYQCWKQQIYLSLCHFVSSTLPHNDRSKIIFTPCAFYFKAAREQSEQINHPVNEWYLNALRGRGHRRQCRFGRLWPPRSRWPFIGSSERDQDQEGGGGPKARSGLLACARCGRGIPGKWRGIRQRGIDKRRVRNRGRNITESLNWQVSREIIIHTPSSQTFNVEIDTKKIHCLHHER